MSKQAILIGVIIGTILGCVVGGHIAIKIQTQAWQDEFDNYIPTKYQLQERLCNQGYTVEIDGFIGPNTLEQWERYICDQYAIKAFERIGVE